MKKKHILHLMNNPNSNKTIQFNNFQQKKKEKEKEKEKEPKKAEAKANLINKLLRLEKRVGEGASSGAGTPRQLILLRVGVPKRSRAIERQRAVVLLLQNDGGGSSKSLFLNQSIINEFLFPR